MVFDENAIVVTGAVVSGPGLNKVGGGGANEVVRVVVTPSAELSVTEAESGTVVVAPAAPVVVAGVAVGRWAVLLASAMPLLVRSASAAAMVVMVRRRRLERGVAGSRWAAGGVVLWGRRLPRSVSSSWGAGVLSGAGSVMAACAATE